MDQYGAPYISFELTDAGAKIFGDYTAQHVGDILAIVLDNVVLSAPNIKSAIPDGQGIIEGKFTREEADSLAVQMRYGALPVPLEVVNRRTIGATLGADSVRQSIIAGIIGLSMVLLFMIVYYRLPGVLAAVALVLYAGLNLALVQADAGDADVTRYRRLPVIDRYGGGCQHPDLRAHEGRAALGQVALSTRSKLASTGRGRRSCDSNLSTLITCLILILFGRTFGAQSVMGFAVTLAIGVLISMFTAVTVTRTFMRAVFERSSSEALRSKRWLLGF